MAVCLNHPDRQATDKCITCFKPLCHECGIREDDLIFCSEKCKSNYLRTSGSVNHFQQLAAARERRKLRNRIIILFALAAMAVTAYWFMKNQPDAAKQLRERTVELEKQLRRKVDAIKTKNSK